jgi:hypothetical protein
MHEDGGSCLIAQHMTGKLAGLDIMLAEKGMGGYQGFTSSMLTKISLPASSA